MALPPTETRLEASLGLDDMTTLERLTLMNEQDRIAVEAVGAVLPQLAELVEVAAGAVRAGGSIHYFGAGTSGRLGVLDAAELLPTYNLPDDIVVGHIAGGERALVHAVENSEDSVVDGARAAAELGPNDVAIGLAASGNTPYVGAALQAARAQGAATALISCNPHAALAPLADIDIVLRTGAEVVTGDGVVTRSPSTIAPSNLSCGSSPELPAGAPAPAIRQHRWVLSSARPLQPPRR